jgi:hypothetical protein
VTLVSIIFTVLNTKAALTTRPGLLVPRLPRVAGRPWRDYGVVAAALTATVTATGPDKGDSAEAATYGLPRHNSGRTEPDEPPRTYKRGVAYS